MVGYCARAAWPPNDTGRARQAARRRPPRLQVSRPIQRTDVACAEFGHRRAHAAVPTEPAVLIGHGQGGEGLRGTARDRHRQRGGVFGIDRWGGRDPVPVLQRGTSYAAEQLPGIGTPVTAANPLQL